MVTDTFMGRDLLLDSADASRLYHEFAENDPIYDFHNHLSPKNIAEGRRFSDLAELWLEGDHYKWRAMRCCGVDERYITGEAEPYEKFLAWAGVVPLLIGCPLYHWTHLELQRYFGIDLPLTPDTAPEIWRHTREKLAEPGYDAAGLLRMQRVRCLCTTDDPADSLEYHREMRSRDIGFSVLPSFRPDRFLSAGSDGFRAALEQLSAREGRAIGSFDGLKAALRSSLERFAALGCRGATLRRSSTRRSAVKPSASGSWPSIRASCWFSSAASIAASASPCSCTSARCATPRRGCWGS